MGEWYKTTKTIFRAASFFKTRSFTTVYGNNTVVYQRKCSVYGLRISPYTITDIYDRNTVTCNTEKYGRIRRRLRPFTTVYGVRNARPGNNHCCSIRCFVVSIDAFFVQEPAFFDIRYVID
jgi:hypothetical protein